MNILAYAPAFGTEFSRCGLVTIGFGQRDYHSECVYVAVTPAEGAMPTMERSCQAYQVQVIEVRKHLVSARREVTHNVQGERSSHSRFCLRHRHFLHSRGLGPWTSKT